MFVPHLRAPLPRPSSTSPPSLRVRSPSCQRAPLSISPPALLVRSQYLRFSHRVSCHLPISIVLSYVSRLSNICKTLRPLLASRWTTVHYALLPSAKTKDKSSKSTSSTWLHSPSDSVFRCVSIICLAYAVVCVLHVILTVLSYFLSRGVSCTSTSLDPLLSNVEVALTEFPRNVN